MPHQEPSSESLIARGWHLREVAPQTLRAHAARMRELASADPRSRAYAELFEAWGWLTERERSACERALAQAIEWAGRAQGVDARMACVHLQSYLLSRDARYEASLEVGAPVVDLPDDALPAALRHAACSHRSMVLESLGRHDESLRLHHAAVAAARRHGDPAILAVALGYLGGLQSSLLNLDDAMPPCDEGWALCEHSDWHGVIGTVGTNRMMVLSGLGRHDEACAMAERLMSQEDHFLERHRSLRFFLYGTALAVAGHFERAQLCLDRGLAERPAGQPIRVEWAWTQARIFNRSGRPAEALATVEPFFEPVSRFGNDFPIDRANLFAEAALANEALGDLAAALAHERLAAQAREEAVRQSALARRVTLQIVYELDAAHHQRDAALREQQRATVEQQRLAELNAALEAANLAKTRFLAAASHDLRQPVHALGLQLATLRAVTRRGAAADVRQRMESTVDALTSMFDLLLDMSRMDAGVMPAHPRAVSLHALLVRVADEFADVATAKGLRLALRIPGDAWVRTDPLLFERLLRNLLDNAIKYTARGGVLLAVRPRRTADGQPVWQLQVWDSGRGIAAAEQARVFDEFYQAGDGSPDRAAGLGLGLAIVKRLGALLDHGVELASQPGRGTRVTVWLPHAAAEPAAAAREPRRTAATAALCVAVIEDDSEVRAATRALLAQWGHRVVDGADWRAVLAGCTHDLRPDAVIADYRLRGVQTGDQDAAALCRALKTELPTLIVTGDTAPERLRALAASGMPWLSKPVAPVRLRSWLAALSERPAVTA